MKLDANKKLFNYYLNKTSKYFNISKRYIVKEYFIVKYLTNLFKNSNEYILKGSAALRLVYKCLKRDINDIDLVSKNGLIGKETFINENFNTIENLVYKDTNDFRHAQFLYKYGNKEKDYFNIDYVSIDKYDNYNKLPLSYLIYDYIKLENPILISEYELESVNINVIKLEDIFITKVMAAANKFVSKHNREKEALKHIKDIYYIYKNYKFNYKNLLKDIKIIIEKDKKFLSIERVNEILNFDVLKINKNQKVLKLISKKELNSYKEFLNNIYINLFINFDINNRN